MEWQFLNAAEQLTALILSDVYSGKMKSCFLALGWSFLCFADPFFLSLFFFFFLEKEVRIFVKLLYWVIKVFYGKNDFLVSYHLWSLMYDLVFPVYHNSCIGILVLLYVNIYRNTYFEHVCFFCWKCLLS